MAAHAPRKHLGRRSDIGELSTLSVCCWLAPCVLVVEWMVCRHLDWNPRCQIVSDGFVIQMLHTQSLKAASLYKSQACRGEAAELSCAALLCWVRASWPKGPLNSMLSLSSGKTAYASICSGKWPPMTITLFSAAYIGISQPFSFRGVLIITEFANSLPLAGLTHNISERDTLNRNITMSSPATALQNGSSPECCMRLGESWYSFATAKVGRTVFASSIVLPTLLSKCPPSSSKRWSQQVPDPPTVSKCAALEVPSMV